MEPEGEKRVGFLSSSELLCRSLRAGRPPLADHLLSSTRKLPDANRFVSGRFKRFTIIRTNPNSINASSPEQNRAGSLPRRFCTLYRLTGNESRARPRACSFSSSALSPATNIDGRERNARSYADSEGFYVRIGDCYVIFDS